MSTRFDTVPVWELPVHMSSRDSADERDFPLGIAGFSYGDLYRPESLKRLAEVFYAELAEADPELSAAFQEYAAVKGEGVSPKHESDLIVRTAPYVGRFVARLFKVEAEAEKLAAFAKQQDAIFAAKKDFVHKRVLKRTEAPTRDFSTLHLAAMALQRVGFRPVGDPEFDAATMISTLIEWEKAYDKHLGKKAESLPEGTAEAVAGLREALTRDPGAKAAWIDTFVDSPDHAPAQRDHAFLVHLLAGIEDWLRATQQDPRGKQFTKGWVSFRHPETLDFQNLIQIQRARPDLPEQIEIVDHHLKQRDGFSLTDPRYNSRQIHNETDYCIHCHPREKDSCSHGFPEKDGSFRKNPLGVPLEGCPLDEKISEMHYLHRHGEAIGALATVTIDNPMCPGTGHRICNECMKGCIYQKQTPVNIPQAETGILSQVLGMPYGFEIYGLLTRWNPLNVKRPYPLPYNGKNVLVVGVGPAGYTLANYLANGGYGVVAIDGLKIEPLPVDWTGDADTLPRAIVDINEVKSDLATRIMAGFGGVAEYGITVRWDKNFLTLIYLTLARRREIRIHGGVRLGSTFDIEDAWELGFDHIALATGAGSPTIVPIKNNLLRGMRTASDFLMALQLTGAFKKSLLANLQLRMPVVIIGGGLTSVDTATESMAYYPIQVEWTLDRYETLAAELGETVVRAQFDAEELIILDEFLAHGRIVREERRTADLEGRQPDFISLMRQWGGVTIAYRKTMQDSPAYRLNHEELFTALEEGAYFSEKLSPVEAVADEYGAIKELIFEKQEQTPEGKWRNLGEFVTLPARTVWFAAGTAPNITYEKEFPGTFKLDKWKYFFAGYTAEKGADGRFHPVPSTSPRDDAFFTSYDKDGKLITYYGDNHPKYAGNVVKAMASAKHGVWHIDKLFAESNAALSPADQPARDAAWKTFADKLEDGLRARVVRVERLTPGTVEVVVKAPLAARKYRPGQFFKLQNYESYAPSVSNTKLMFEGQQLAVSWVDPERGTIGLIVPQTHSSSRLTALLRSDEPVVVMGPGGTPTEIPENKNVLLVGNDRGNAVLLGIARALKAANNRVLYFAGYRDGAEAFRTNDIETVADQIVWVTETGREVKPHRDWDAHFRGDMVAALRAYAEGHLGPQMIAFRDIDRLITIGNDRMMDEVRVARKNVLHDYLNPEHTAIGGINSPMQCMMKEVCAQCLILHVDPETGKPTEPVYSCFQQEQKLDEVDFANLHSRRRINSLQEKMTDLWLDHLMGAFHPVVG